MTKLEQIEKSVTELSPEELAKFRDWFAAFEAQHWDQKFEADVRSGRLDGLAEKALSHHRAGRTRPL